MPENSTTSVEPRLTRGSFAFLRQELTTSVVPHEETPRSVALESTLQLPGAYVTFIVDDTESAPAAEVFDTAAALSWFAAVYGDEAADALAEIGQLPSVDSGPGGTLLQIGDLSSAHRFEPSAPSRVLQRIALGVWLSRFWSGEAFGQFSEAAVSLEVAALAWRADTLFLSEQPGRALLDGRVDDLLTLVRAAAAPGVPAQLRLLLLEATSAALELLDDPLVSELRDAGEALEAVLDSSASDDVAPGTPSYEAAAVALLAQLQADPLPTRRSELALAAGGEAFDLESRTASVDWMQVPPRTLDWRENSVRWVLVPADSESSGASISVSVPALPNSAISESLIARVYDGGVGLSGLALPAVVIPLEFDSTSGQYSGVSEVSAGLQADAVRVDIAAIHLARQPLLDDGSLSRSAEDRAGMARVISERFAGTSLTLPCQPRFLGEPASGGQAVELTP